MTNVQEKMKRLYLKQLYNDALYWHLIHNGYTTERAKLEMTRRMKN